MGRGGAVDRASARRSFFPPSLGRAKACLRDHLSDPDRRRLLEPHGRLPRGQAGRIRCGGKPQLRASRASGGILRDWLTGAHDQVERDRHEHRQSCDNNHAIAPAGSLRLIERFEFESHVVTGSSPAANESDKKLTRGSGRLFQRSAKQFQDASSQKRSGLRLVLSTGPSRPGKPLALRSTP